MFLPDFNFLIFQRFTEESIKVILLAQDESRMLGHNFVDTGQILLGLISENTGIAAKTLESMGVNLMDARVEAERIIGPGSGLLDVAIPFTPKAQRLLICACDEADKLGNISIRTEHLLLGLICEVNESPKEEEGRGLADKVLERLGIDLNALRTKILDTIESAP